MLNCHCFDWRMDYLFFIPFLRKICLGLKKYFEGKQLVCPLCFRSTFWLAFWSKFGTLFFFLSFFFFGGGGGGGAQFPLSNPSLALFCVGTQFPFSDPNLALFCMWTQFPLSDPSWAGFFCVWGHHIFTFFTICTQPGCWWVLHLSCIFFLQSEMLSVSQAVIN